MTRPEEHDQRDDDSERSGMSRRDFVQGRFWQAIGLNRSAKQDRSPPTSKTDSERHKSVGSARRDPLVMRYPKSLREVAAGDSDQEAAAPESESKSPVQARRRTIPVLRPPGAIEEASFLDGCTRCDLCRQACPHDAIIHAPQRLREAAGTPVIDPDHQPCMMCTDFPCITACEPNVLTSLIPKLMGTARITEHLCLPHHGTTCTVCSERCPVSGAIDVTDGKPTINEKQCTGCGVCRHVCPAPENAILLMPTFLRPLPHTPSTHQQRANPFEGPE